MNIQTAVLCDAATDDNGKLNLLGAFDTIYARELPAIHPQCAVGVVGYLPSLPIGRAWIWKGVLVLSAVRAAGLLGLEVILLRSYDAPLRIQAMTLAGAALPAPALIILYRYAFRITAIWREPAYPTRALTDAEYSSGR